MVIWSEFRMGQYRNDSHREDATHFTTSNFLIIDKECELAMEGLKKLQKKGNYQRDDLLKYPQNSLRNLARDRLDTKLFYLVDIDTIPAAGLRDEFNKYAKKVEK